MLETVLDLVHLNVAQAGHRVVHDSVVGAFTEKNHGWLLVDAGRRTMPLLNGALALEPDAGSAVNEVEKWFSDRNSQPLFRLRSEIDQPIIKELSARGYNANRTEPVLYLPDPAPSPNETPLEIVEVRTQERLKAVFEQVGGHEAMDEFGYAMSVKTLSMPGTTELWGLLDNKLVAGAIVLATPPLAGIYAVGTVQQYRRRGFGTAITWAAVRAGLNMGADSVWMGSTDMALSMYLNMGFKQIAEYRMMVKE